MRTGDRRCVLLVFFPDDAVAYCEHLQVKTERSYGGSLRNMEAFHIRQAQEGRYPLLLIDEAQSLNRDELRLIHHLFNFCSNERVLLMIVLVG